MSRTRAIGPALHILFFFSGVSALGYQLVWTKMFSTGLGHEMPALLAIVFAFMIGTAIGAAILDRFIPRSVRAGIGLGVLELATGAWALTAIYFIPHANDFAVRLIGISPGVFKHWAVCFMVPAITLLPATVAMGGTLPAMEKFLSAIASERASIAGVYAANTFGAVAGTLLTPYVLMPELGFSKSCWVLAAVNILTGVGALIFSVRVPGARRGDASAPRRPLISTNRLGLTLFFTGLLGISYETAAVRVLAQILKNTVFTYAAILAVFLLGTTLGAAAYHMWWRRKEPRQLLATLLCSAAGACFVGVVLASRALSLYAVLRELGDSPAAVLAAELLATAAILAVPSFCMGAAFSHLAHWARVTVGQIGHAVAVNTIGAAVAPALCGVVVIPLLGAKWTMVLLGFGYLVLLPARPKPFVSLLSGIACLGAMAIHLRILAIPPGAQVVHYAEGTTASVAVIEEGNSRTLRVDNSFQMGGTGAADTEYLQAHIPLLLHPAPRRALFLGLGTGISFGAASLYPQVHADGAELLPEVAQAMSFFAPQNFAPREQPNLSMHIADARRFVRNASQVYDVIIGDVFHPYRDGAGALYTREHFAAVHRRLAPAGIFCQWLPLHQIDEPTLRVIVHTFQQEFPSAEAWLLRFNVDVPVMALIGSGGRVWSTRAAESRGKNERLEGELKRLAISDSLRLYGHLLAEAEDLRRFADGAPLNTDDDQRVTFMAPRFAYRKNAKPYSSLLALLNVSQAASSAAGHFKATDGEFAQRLAKYLTARNVYLRGLVDAAEHREMGAVAAYVESARISPDFTSGYAQCLSLVSIIANSNPVRAREILTALDAAQPERPVAREMLQRLFAR